MLSETSMLSTLESVQLPGGHDVEVKVESRDSSDTISKIHTIIYFHFEILMHTIYIHAVRIKCNIALARINYWHTSIIKDIRTN